MQHTDRFNFFSGNAVVDEAIEPEKRGRVRFRGSYWFATCDRSIALCPGMSVKVVGHSHITLVVEPTSGQLIRSVVSGQRTANSGQ